MILLGLLFLTSDYLDWIIYHAMLTKKSACGKFKFNHTKPVSYLPVWPHVGVIMLPALQVQNRLSWPLPNLLYSLVFHCFSCCILLLLLLSTWSDISLLLWKYIKRTYKNLQGFFSFSGNVLKRNMVIFSITILSYNYYQINRKKHLAISSSLLLPVPPIFLLFHWFKSINIFC